MRQGMDTDRPCVPGKPPRRDEVGKRVESTDGCGDQKVEQQTGDGSIKTSSPHTVWPSCQGTSNRRRSEK